jgi:ssRNA-specific RNase YbeY (16S rRNA maturation enzyme)
MVSSTLKANTRCKRSVSFKGTVLVHGVLHLKNYTEEEIRACWFDREDMENIKRRAYSILKKLQKQREEEGDSSMFDMSSLD